MAQSMCGCRSEHERILMDIESAGRVGQRGLHKKMTIAGLDKHLVDMKYAVRGSVVAKADELKERLDRGEDLGFEEIVPCNIGNPHAVGQKPITFYRQVAACCTCPELCEEGGPLPDDVKKRARDYLAATGGNGVGAYTGSTGIRLVREQVAAFIGRRDGFPADPEAITLHTGASEGVKRVIQALVSKEDDVIMIPKPQYPLYSAALTMNGGQALFYECDEENDWAVTRQELEAAYLSGHDEGYNVKAIAVINPGNPTGNVLSEEDVKMFVDFAHEKGIPILADEVYQANVYAEGKKFHSFKKVLRTMESADSKYASVQLMSFHSTSKGLIGECGFRGGYTEFVGMSQKVLALFFKVASTSLSSNTLGQIMVGLMVTPPAEGEASHALFQEETAAIFSGLKERAKLLSDGLNAIPGISTRSIEGAMYAFAKVEVPARAVQHALKSGMKGDEFWCLELVEKTGIVCVPGTGFGQKEGTFHFRITILPPSPMLTGMLARLKSFQESFLNTWA